MTTPKKTEEQMQKIFLLNKNKYLIDSSNSTDFYLLFHIIYPEVCMLLLIFPFISRLTKDT